MSSQTRLSYLVAGAVNLHQGGSSDGSSATARPPRVLMHAGRIVSSRRTLSRNKEGTATRNKPIGADVKRPKKRDRPEVRRRFAALIHKDPPRPTAGGRRSPCALPSSAPDHRRVNARNKATEDARRAHINRTIAQPVRLLFCRPSASERSTVSGRSEPSAVAAATAVVRPPKSRRRGP
uniref:Uncharacterized protein n=1 Tax=Plectus sambesii TaxID=2011161 RepID=A0A914V7Q6_9BILA